MTILPLGLLELAGDFGNALGLAAEVESVLVEVDLSLLLLEFLDVVSLVEVDLSLLLLELVDVVSLVEDVSEGNFIPLPDFNIELSKVPPVLVDSSVLEEDFEFSAELSVVVVYSSVLEVDLEFP